MQEKHNRHNRISLTCGFCGVEFAAYPCERNRSYCNKKCADAAKRHATVTKDCPRCGTHFTALDKGSKTRKYCRKGCGPDKAFKCVICGKPFTLEFYRWNNGRGKYCSRKCASALLRGARLAADIQKRVEKRCGHCGGPYWLAPAAAVRRVNGFCTKQCRILHRESRMIERACKWCGGTFRRSVSQIEAFGGEKRCQFCSKSCAGAYTVRHCQNRVSVLETSFFDLLEKHGLKVLRQCRVGRYSVDGLVASAKAIIEFDGVYWHSRKATIKLDEKKDSLFREQGYRLIRVRDLDFNKNPRRVIQRVLAQLTAPQGVLFPR